MFLKILANPHSGGRLTRTVLYEPHPGQVFAIDAERLHKEPALLSQFSRRASLGVRALDLTAYLVLVVSVIASFFIAFWLFIPGVAACTFMLAANRKTAGEIALRRAADSFNAFRELHEQGLLWLVVPDRSVESA